MTDHQHKLFRAAIEEGRLCANAESPVCVDHFMLMGERDGRGIFKHRESRFYLSTNGQTFISINGIARLSLVEHQTFLRVLMQTRARYHGIGSVTLAGFEHILPSDPLNIDPNDQGVYDRINAIIASGDSVTLRRALQPPEAGS